MSCSCHTNCITSKQFEYEAFLVFVGMDDADDGAKGDDSGASRMFVTSCYGHSCFHFSVRKLIVGYIGYSILLLFI
eukprot:TRINITY_DN1924_c0_g1_i2.p1 TRINITY_DN1924_c0_g1~~TRINITY_DN1924_c0_g1_i2.p1  ORF type:complete len:76 (+),score=3.09 TRINITY_DN1924_c0_g1_i2:970-1197(+)